MKSDFVARNDDAFAAQMQTFKTLYPAYAAVLTTVPAAEVDAQAADADYFSYVLGVHDIMRNGAQQSTGWKGIVRFGASGDTPAGEPALPVFPKKVAPVAPGIEGRFRSLARKVKDDPNCNASIEEALGISGPEQTGPDMATVQPLISVRLAGGEVQIKWGWGGHSEFLSACEIQVDRGDDKGFVLLTIDTTPNYNDTTPIPSTPAKWAYRAIYRVGDHRVGQWSNPVSVAVGS